MRDLVVEGARFDNRDPLAVLRSSKHLTCRVAAEDAGADVNLSPEAWTFTGAVVATLSALWFPQVKFAPAATGVLPQIAQLTKRRYEVDLVLSPGPLRDTIADALAQLFRQLLEALPQELLRRFMQRVPQEGIEETLRRLFEPR